ncbi:hypothetical protein NPIL_577671 [Nephila pilipes]|uniref:Uncharacterized protein n=1 Tax=Nephila pilipes TaxID=299642 RepID=A0A8X6QUA7_NEPPI|nr:hypothetical protein NPIL_577671 [Nephila pilipes]
MIFSNNLRGFSPPSILVGTPTPRGHLSVPGAPLATPPLSANTKKYPQPFQKPTKSLLRTISSSVTEKQHSNSRKLVTFKKTTNTHYTKHRESRKHSKEQIRRVVPHNIPLIDLQAGNKKSAGVKESPQWWHRSDNGGEAQMTPRS